MRKIIFIFIVLILTASCTGEVVTIGGDSNNSADKPKADFPYSKKNDWASSDIISISTGLGIADINKDGFPDMVIANGNDIKRQFLVVYYGKEDGTISSEVGWKSSDKDYHGHLAIGDLDKDGFDDVVVSVFLGENDFESKGYVKAYYNKNGTLESKPSWRSDDDFYTFSLSLGDIDNDGDLDLAVATGESYTNKAEKNKLFINENGRFNTKPSWEPDIADYSMDVAFGDIDNDGDLDLVFARSKGENVLYINNNGTIEKMPNWISKDNSRDSNSIVLGDVNKDGFIDILVSDNYQLGGSGRFKLYLNNKGAISDVPDWVSSERGYGSGINLADLDNDGYIDLVTGTWGEKLTIGTGRIRIYKNNEGIFSNESDWVSDTKSVVEAITFADMNKDNIILEEELIKGKSLFYLKHIPFEYIDNIIVNDVTLTKKDYCYDKELGWVSINKNLIKDESAISIKYAYSNKLDIIVSNWDDNKGNFIFYCSK